MIIGVDALLAKISRFWIVSVVGEKGACKDLLVSELATYWLRQGYKFYSNQLGVWNDPIYRFPENEQEEKDSTTLDINQSGVKVFVDIRRRVCVLSEGGRYLREYKYFEDLFEFARKVKTIFFFPSTRPPHVDLQVLTLSPRFQFEEYFGFLGGVWRWSVSDGYNKPQIGHFLFLPFGRYIGIYDTGDFTENPDKLLKAIRQLIDVEQKKRGRDGISSMATTGEANEMDALISHQKRIEQYALSLSDKNRKKVH